MQDQPQPLPIALSDFGQRWYNSRDEITVSKVSMVDKKDIPVNALTNPVELKALQDDANRKLIYDDTLYDLNAWYTDSIDVVFNMIPELLSGEPFNATIQKDNRLRGIAVILLALGLISLLVEALMSDI